MPTVCYIYDGCDTCRKAKRWLAEHEVAVTFKPIRETPPSAAELKRMREHLDGEVKRLFNTSSRDYREGGYKDRLADMSWSEVVAALRANGNLVKRPFLLTADGGSVGFKPEVWGRLLGV